jgi:Fe-S oxidoreductase
MSPAAEQAWATVFSAVGVTLRIPNVGCCGMCGVFGHEAAHLNESVGIYALSWQPKLYTPGIGDSNYLVSGHSCRSQVHRVDGVHLPHPLLGLLERLA